MKRNKDVEIKDKEQLEIETESKVKALEKSKENLVKWSNSHGRTPTSRREFLAAGALNFAGTMMMPSIVNVLANSSVAQAADIVCPDAGAASAVQTMPAFITVNLAGGALLAANFVPHDLGRQPLTSYNTMGMGNGAVPIQREFGNVPFAGPAVAGGPLIAQFLQGILNTTSAATRAKTAFIGIPCRSRDDTRENKFDASGMITKLGNIGQMLPPLGSKNTPTGINQTAGVIAPPSPLVVSKLADIQGAIGLSGSLGTLPVAVQGNVFKLVQKLNGMQLDRLMKFTGGQNLATLVKCASDKNVSLSAVNAAQFDARASAIAGVWGLAANTSVTAQNTVFGSMVLSALTGKSGCVGLELGGFDYHGNSRQNTNAKDLEAGTLVGRCLESASLTNSKVMIYVTSDGAVSSDASDDRQSQYTGDHGSSGIAFVLMFDPAGRPVTKDFQIGQFTTGQAADDKFVLGNNPELVAAGVCALYAKWSGKMGILNQVIPGKFTDAQLAQILVI